MKYNRLGDSDLVVSEIGFGCQSIGGGLYYKDDAESIYALQAAFDNGVNFFDTSDHYSQGGSELLIGKAFKGKRDNVIIGTKAGTLYTPTAAILLRLRPLLRPAAKYLYSMKIPFHIMRAKQKKSNFSRNYLTNAVEKSLKRLQTDYIDLFQLHKPDFSVIDIGELIESLEMLKQQGKIRYYGISCRANEDAFGCFNYAGITSIQITLNLLDRKFVPGILECAKKKKVGIIARNPRAQGHLTRQLSDIMGETYAHNKSEFETKKERAREFHFLVKPNRTLAQAALKFVLSFEGVTTAIPRAINHIQLQENLDTLNCPPLTVEEMEKIYSIGNSVMEVV